MVDDPAGEHSGGEEGIMMEANSEGELGDGEL